MPELDRIGEALVGVRRELALRVGCRSLQSIVDQLDYFAAYRRGENDGARLASMNMGVLAMREIETGNLDLAMKIYRIEREAHRAAEDIGNA